MAGVANADDPLLTPWEIIALTRSSMRSFRRWTASGELEVLHLGRLVRVRRSAFAFFLRKNSPRRSSASTANGHSQRNSLHTAWRDRDWPKVIALLASDLQEVAP